jgi:hypothetical protein
MRRLPCWKGDAVCVVFVELLHCCIDELIINSQ